MACTRQLVSPWEVKKDLIGDELLREELRLSEKDHKCQRCQLAATVFPTDFGAGEGRGGR